MDCPHELCHFGSDTVALPYAITSEPEVLAEMLNLETWNELLTGDERKRLMALLPDVGCDDPAEHKKTLEIIFTGGCMHFGNPVDQLIEDIRSGRNQPEVLELHKRTIRRKKREAACRLRSYYYTLLKQCVASRQTMLENYSTNNFAWAQPKRKLAKRSVADVRARQLMERAERRVAKEMRQIELDSMFCFGKRSRIKLETSSESSGEDDSSSSSLSPAPGDDDKSGLEDSR